MSDELTGAIAKAIVWAGFYVLSVWALKVCWNLVVPAVFGLPTIGFVEAMALMAISALLRARPW